MNRGVKPFGLPPGFGPARPASRGVKSAGQKAGGKPKGLAPLVYADE